MYPYDARIITATVLVRFEGQSIALRRGSRVQIYDEDTYYATASVQRDTEKFGTLAVGTFELAE